MSRAEEGRDTIYMVGIQKITFCPMQMCSCLGADNVLAVTPHGNQMFRSVQGSCAGVLRCMCVQ